VFLVSKLVINIWASAVVNWKYR